MCHVCLVPREATWGHWVLCIWSFRWSWVWMRVIGIITSGRVVSAQICWTISPTLLISFIPLFICYIISIFAWFCFFDFMIYVLHQNVISLLFFWFCFTIHYYISFYVIWHCQLKFILHLKLMQEKDLKLWCFGMVKEEKQDILGCTWITKRHTLMAISSWSV